MAAPRGVRKVSENIIQDGRALIITEEDASQLDWGSIPAGSLKINKKNGLMSVKIEGETDWLPAGLKNDGTLGGIVGGSLTQNGWVKFSNGLILQWGSINIIYGTGFYTLNFPITFNSLYTIVDGGIFDVEIQSRNNYAI